jgi:hypothetical protein
LLHSVWQFLGLELRSFSFPQLLFCSFQIIIIIAGLFIILV